jgi:mannose-6-phosphate isomerase-like protein (cupin superfamily)
MRVIRQEELPLSNIARELVGADHGIDGISVILVEAPPGSSVSLHRHDYDEVIIVQAGRGLFRAGDDEAEVGGGALVVVPAGTPHGFRNVGSEPLVQVDIHASSRFGTEWLEHES